VYCTCCSVSVRLANRWRLTRELNAGKREEAANRELGPTAMSRIPVSTLSPSHPRALQEPLSFPTDRAVSPVPSSRHNSVHSAPMSSLSGHAGSTSGKKLSKRALGDEVSITYYRWFGFSFLSFSGVCVRWLGRGTQTSPGIFSLSICVSSRV